MVIKLLELQCNLFAELRSADGIVVRWLGKELVRCVILCCEYFTGTSEIWFSLV